MEETHKRYSQSGISLYFENLEPLLIQFCVFYDASTGGWLRHVFLAILFHTTEERLQEITEETASVLGWRGIYAEEDLSDLVQVLDVTWITLDGQFVLLTQDDEHGQFAAANYIRLVLPRKNFEILPQINGHTFETN